MTKMRKVRSIGWRLLLACLLSGVFGFAFLASASQAEAGFAQDDQTSTTGQPGLNFALATEPCQLLTAGGVFNNPGALGGPVFAQGQGVPLEGAAHLVITCLRFDRSHYPYGAGWHSELVVTNSGVASADPFDVSGELCRFMANGITFQCSPSSWNLGSASSGLAPGESVLMQSNSFGFTLPLDPANAYPSWVAGLPDNGAIFLRARIATMPSGQYAVAEAVYPSAPLDESGDPNFVDEDQDGWSPFGGLPDCNDSNPNIHPGALEISGDGADNDCDGGDVGLGGVCDSYYGTIHGETDFCGQPGAVVNPGNVDLDGDSFSASEGDCDDSDPFTHPLAPELNDSFDNNCNGLIDETFGTPDWVIDDYDVVRTMGEYPLTSGVTVLVPGLDYDVTLGNIGDYIGVDFSSIQAVGHYVIFHPQPMATGTSGFIPYTQLPVGYLYGCTEQAFSAAIADSGLYGEINTANNYETYWLPPITEDYLSLHFDEMPSLPVFGGGDNTQIVSHAALTGTCPDLPTSLDGSTEYIQIYRRLLGKNQVLHNETLLGLNYTPAISLPEDVSIGDKFCLQVTLDPNHLVAEVDPDDNMYAIVYEYHNPVFGPPRFDVVEYVHGAAAGVEFNTDGCPESTDGALIGGSPSPTIVILGAVLVGLLGGVVGGVGGHIGGASGPARVGIILAGLLAGGLLGGIGADQIRRMERSPGPDENIITMQPADPVSAGLPACEGMARVLSTYPKDGAVIEALDPNPLTWQASFGTSANTPNRVTFQVVSPGGSELLIQADLNPRGVPNNYETIRSIGSELYLHGINLTDEPGEYLWSVVNASQVAGGRQVPICSADTTYSFVVSEPPSQPPTTPPTLTASPTQGLFIPPTITTEKPGAPPPPTRTPKPTSPPPTRTPIPLKKTPTPTPYFP